MPDLVENGVSLDVETIARALVNIYKQEFDIDHYVEENLYRETCRIFEEAVENGMADAAEAGVPLPSADFIQELQHNTEVFSAFRVHRMQQDIAAQMVDADGQLKPFRQFVKDVSPYIEHRNRAWLQTEYDTAILRAQNAAEWKEFRAEADVYPNLEWIPSTSPNPGADHIVYWGTVRPVNDPFWDEHKPGDRWNCKCELRQTERNETPVPRADDKQDAQPGLENNPADGRIFSRKHPYFPKDCTACPFAGNKLAALVSNLAGRRDCNRCRACDKRIATAKRKAEAQQKSKQQGKRSAQTKAFEKLDTFKPSKISIKSLQTGVFNDSKDGYRAIISHCYDEDRFRAAMALRKKVGKLKFVRVSPFGEGKNLSNPKDIKNLRKKKRRGVICYNVYEWKHKGYVYEVKMEVNKHGFESLYWLKRKRE